MDVDLLSTLRRKSSIEVSFLPVAPGLAPSPPQSPTRHEPAAEGAEPPRPFVERAALGVGMLQSVEEEGTALGDEENVSRGQKPLSPLLSVLSDTVTVLGESFSVFPTPEHPIERPSNGGDRQDPARPSDLGEALRSTLRGNSSVQPDHSSHPPPQGTLRGKGGEKGGPPLSRQESLEASSSRKPPRTYRLNSLSRCGLWSRF
jgi:hypothetical protein